MSEQAPDFNINYMQASEPTHPGFRIYVLGAGFSRPAGLPLATELFSEVRACIEGKFGKETKFDRDLHNYLDYCKDCGIHEQSEDHLDLELFMTYLDIEHYLGLRGGDTWGQAGGKRITTVDQKGNR